MLEPRILLSTPFGLTQQTGQEGMHNNYKYRKNVCQTYAFFEG